MIPLVTADEMRDAEQAFVASGGSLSDLMTRAGAQVAARIDSPGLVLILAGPGNNGGDGLATARVLRGRGQEAFVYTYRRDAEKELPSIRSEDDTNLDILRQELDRADVIVDGLLGIGRKRPIEDVLAKVIELVNNIPVARRIAIDIPTGIDADTGEVETVAFRADLTVTLGLGKRGLWSFPAAEYAGEVVIADIGIPQTTVIDQACGLVTWNQIRALLPARGLDWNKGESGTVLVIAGSRDFSGAPSLVAMSAYRAGAGLVSVAVPSSIQHTVAAHGVEPVFVPTSGANGWFTPDTLNAMDQAIEKADSFAIGPGLGTHPETVCFILDALKRFKEVGLKGVVDADALNALAQSETDKACIPQGAVLTPHPGEMSRLLHLTVPEVQRDRFAAVRKAAGEWNATVLLKGTYSLVAAPSQPIAVNPTGGPNLATGGTGDVLTGIISSLIAQKMEPREAAIAGAFLHGAAGDEVRGRFGDAGTVASDLWPLIPQIRRRIQENSWPGGMIT